MARPWVIAHNGGMERSAAGSLAAFADALDSGCEAIEFDVRRLGDGTLVVAHDPDLGGHRLEGLDRAALEEIPGHPPRLEEVLALFRTGQHCNLELKEDGYVEAVLAMAERHLAAERTLVSSFLDGVVATVRTLRPDLQTGLVLARLRDPVPTAADLARRVEATGAASVCLRHTLVDGLLDAVVALGVPALVWTVNDPAQLEALLADPRVGGVFTDHPRRALAIRRDLGRGV